MPEVFRRIVARKGWVPLALFAALVLGLAPVSAAAQTAPPSVKILKGTLQSPDSAEASYYQGASTSTDGLCRDYGPASAHPVSDICPSGGRPRPPEIKALARALKNDPDLIYEYVRNSIDTEFLFGVHKGPIGAIVDKAGSNFDQSELMVELLREAGITARYKFGTITLNAQQFQDWTGLGSADSSGAVTSLNAQAACDFLATGGIPAVVNGTVGAPNTSVCTGAFDHALMAHVWVEADVPNTGGGGTTAYLFDPSFKPYTRKTGIPGGVRAAMGFSAGEPVTKASIGMTSASDGQSYVSGANRAQLETKLQAYGATLTTRLKLADMQGADMTDVVGGLVLKPAIRPSGGWRQTSLSYVASVRATWTGGVPDKYRATLKLYGYASTATPPYTTPGVLVDATFFSDEIYARRLEIDSTPVGTPSGPHPVVQYWAPVLKLDRVPIQTGVARIAPDVLYVDLQITVDHPFAGAGELGANRYADAVINKLTYYAQPAEIVWSFGATSPGLLAKWEREQANDSIAPATFINEPGAWDPPDTLAKATGDVTRARVGAMWLGQYSRALWLHAQIADSREVPLHVAGVVSAGYNSQWAARAPGAESSFPDGFNLSDEVTSIDLEASVGLVSRTSSELDRRAALHAIAATAASLEGGVIEQLSDSPDGASTARRFAWSETPSSADTAATASRKIYRFIPGALGTGGSEVTSRSLFDNATTYSSATFTTPEGIVLPAVDSGTVGAFRGSLSNAIQAYATNSTGFEVIASSEAFAAPGHRLGSEYSFYAGYPSPTFKRYPSLQRGGAFVATQYDASGDLKAIAHVITRYTTSTKGGGGPLTSQMPQYNPQEAAQSVKDRFVDRANVEGVDLTAGTAGYTSPVLASVGQGEFPYRLEARFETKGGALRTPRNDCTGSSCTNPHIDQDGFVGNWENTVSFSNSGYEALGQSRVEAAAPTLVAFVSMQDAWRTALATDHPSIAQQVTGLLVANWWQDHLLFNVASVSSGARVQQFVRLMNPSGDDKGAGTFIATSGGDRLTITSGRTYVRPILLDLNPGFRSPASTPLQTEAVQHAWNYQTVTQTNPVTVTGVSGDVRSYISWAAPAFPTATNYSLYQGFRMTGWRFPQGVEVSLEYGDNQRGAIPTRVYNNAGASLDLQDLGEGCANTYDLVDAAGAHFKTVFAAPVARSQTQRPFDGCLLTQVYDPTDLAVPALQYAYDNVNLVSQASDAVAIRAPAARGPHQFFVAEGYRGERLDPVGGRYSVEHMSAGAPEVAILLRETAATRTVKAATLTRHTDELNRAVTSLADGRGRILARTYPEGDQDLFAYTGLDQIQQITRNPKPGAVKLDGTTPEPSLTVSATYDSTWNKLAALTDAKGNSTLFAYGAPAASGASLMISATRPSPSAGGSGGGPVYGFSYNSLGQLLTATDPTGVVTQNAYDATSKFLVSTTLDPGSGAHVAAVTSFTNDAIGNVTAVTDPLGRVTNLTYDPDRRKVFEISPDPDGAGALLRPAVKHTYDLAGRETRTDRGRTTSSTGSDFAVLATVAIDYDLVGNKLKVTTPAGVSQMSYDGMNRLTCGAVRMNPAVYAALPSDACVLSPEGLAGPDRITRTTWDLAGQIVRIEKAYGTALAFEYGAWTWGDDGEQLSVKDARANRTTYEYDGFNRARKTRLPVTTAAADTSSTTDYELYDYDANGNRVRLRKRDGRSISYCFDAIDRQTRKFLNTASPNCAASSGAADDVYTAYDAAGRPTAVLFQSATGQGIAYGYDSAGRLTSETSFGRAMAYGWDKAGNRTRVTWPDTSFYVDYEYDPLNRVSKIKEKGGSSGAPLLAVFGYDDLGRRTGLTRGNGTTTGWGWDTADRLTSLAHDPASTAYDQTWGYSYNPASQVIGRTAGNALYDWTNRPAVTVTKSYDGLNRDAGLASLGDGYDLNGNVTHDARQLYGYDIENRLVSVADAGTSASVLSLAYDPLGRLRSQTASGVPTQFLYDGDRLAAEYNSGGTLTARYVHGAGVDEPLVWYGDSGVGLRRHLYSDAQGSVVARSGDATGSVAKVYAYGPYGEPQAWDDSRFAYTGQIELREAGLYYYKARVYDPSVGRFLQTDPVGYEADLDLYTYVGGDPLNRVDPTGTLPAPIGHNLPPVVPPPVPPQAGILILALPLRGDTAEPPTIQRPNADLIETVDNIIKDQLNDRTLVAAQRELAGEIVKINPRDGESFDHVYKVQRGQQGLMNHIRTINDRLSSPTLPTADRNALQSLLSRASRALDRSERFVPRMSRIPGRGGHSTAPTNSSRPPTG